MCARSSGIDLVGQYLSQHLLSPQEGETQLLRSSTITIASLSTTAYIQSEAAIHIRNNCRPNGGTISLSFSFGSLEVVIVIKRKETMALPQQLLLLCLIPLIYSRTWSGTTLSWFVNVERGRSLMPSCALFASSSLHSEACNALGASEVSSV